jgi:hypothetical protein
MSKLGKKGFQELLPSKKRFMLWRSDTDEYLAEAKSNDSKILTGWCKHPEKALMFTSAKSAADFCLKHEISKPCGLDIMEYEDIGDQIRVTSTGKSVLKE